MSKLKRHQRGYKFLLADAGIHGPLGQDNTNTNYLKYLMLIGDRETRRHAERILRKRGEL